MDYSAYHEQGFVVLPCPWPRELLDALEADVRELYRRELAELRYPDEAARELNRRRFFVHDLRWKIPRFGDFLRSEPFRSVCTELLGPDVDTHYDGAIIKCAGDGHAIDWHQNEGLNVFGVKRHLTCFTAITEMTAENGCLDVIPKSHLRGLLPHVHSDSAGFQECESDKTGAVPIEMQRGEILVIHPLLLHSSGENKSGDLRIGYVPVLQASQVVVLNGRRIPVSPVFRGGRPAYD